MHLDSHLRTKVHTFTEVFSNIYLNKYKKKSSFELQGALSSLRQFLAAESPLKVMKNAFYFTSKALFVLKVLKFLL